MRGNLIQDLPPPESDGSIPTHAGKPDQGIQDGESRWVYPHACGETRRGIGVADTE